MKRTPTLEEDRFCQVARTFIDAHWSGQQAGASALVKRDRWFQALVAAGFAVPHWPVSEGGTGWSLRERYLWRRELAAALAPLPDPVATHWAGPALLQAGTAAQRARWLPGIRELKTRCCLSLEDWDPIGGGLGAIGRTQRVPGANASDLLLTLLPEQEQPGTQSAEYATTLCVVNLRAPGVVRARSARSAVVELPPLQTAVADGIAQRLGEPGSGQRELGALVQTVLSEPTSGLHLASAMEALDRVASDLPGDDGALDADPAWQRRRAELDVTLIGLEALAERLAAGHAPAAIAAVLRERLTDARDTLEALLVDSFGYYASVDADPELLHNEGPIGHHGLLSALRSALRADDGTAIESALRVLAVIPASADSESAP
ncbi:MAG: acyl-CoA dehydrogenase family protein [Pseudomonadales bacterium]